MHPGFRSTGEQFDWLEEARVAAGETSLGEWLRRLAVEAGEKLLGRPYPRRKLAAPKPPKKRH
jgi:hypothetical protein